jgi:hypothetical protein
MNKKLMVLFIMLLAGCSSMDNKPCETPDNTDPKNMEPGATDVIICDTNADRPVAVTTNR